MIDFGFHLLAALFAGLIYWIVRVLWGQAALTLRSFASDTTSGAVLVYFFWLFSSGVHITVGR